MKIILIVENHSQLRESIKVLLRKYDARLEIIEADTGRKGIDITTQQRPDVIVLDIMLPDMNGLDVAKKIKGKSATSKIILLTMCAKHVLCQCDSVGITTVLKKNDIYEKIIPIIRSMKEERERSMNKRNSNKEGVCTEKI